MAKIADKYYVADPWKVIEQGFNPSYARVSESIFSLSNENIGVRGSFDEGGSVDSLRGVYVNGVYELQELPKSYLGIVDKTHFMVPTVDWIETKISIDGEVLDLGKVKFSDFTRVLDMKSGTLTRSFIWHTATGKDIKLTFIRFMDMVHNERAYQRMVFEALNFSGEVELTSGLSFNMIHEGRNTCVWGETKTRVIDNMLTIMSQTLVSKKEVFAAAIVDVKTPFDVTESDKSISLNTKINLEQGTSLNVDKKVVIIFDDKSTGETLQRAGETLLQKAKSVSVDQALAEQKAYWEKHWAMADVVIEPSDSEVAESVAEEQQGIRFCSFQMAQTYNGGNVHHNIGAKGLTGEAYNGHAFWDSEACCLPFYLFTNPNAARSLLLFRYNTLPQALERAKMLDCKGACYPIATLNGDEACDLWQHASLQQQPSTAVAYGIWHYVKVTGDEELLWEFGAEILAQIARFLVSRVDRNPHTGEYGFYGVMGPDEFHMMVNNNAYSNYMGKRSLDYAVEVVKAMKENHLELYKALTDKIGLTENEIESWELVSSNMALPITKDGLFEQFDGYFDKPYLDVNSIPVDEFPLYSNWSYDRIYRTSMIKQPDVLMFLYLYNSSFSEEIKRVNYEFYEPRTIHESSLSPAVHSVLAAELGKMDEAIKFFGFVTRLDLDNYNRNTREGLHTTSIAMAWINIIYGFAGLRSDDDVLHFSPRLPDRWKTLKFSLTWQGRNLSIEMKTNETIFTLLQGEPMDLLVYGKKATLGEDGLKVATE